MRNARWPIAIVVALMILVAVAAVPVLRAQDSPDIDDETCLACHDDMAGTLQHSPHALSTMGTRSNVTVSCVSCHAGGTIHADDPSVDNIGNPARQSAQDVFMICENCHSAHRELDNIGFDPHMMQGLSCVNCHTVHSERKGLLVDDEQAFCGQCHSALLSDFGRTSTHPVNDGQVSCLSCHDFTGRLEPAHGAGWQENCYSCHPMQAGPFPWPHQAASSYYPGGEGCVACHSPHGSPNDRLLNQPGDGLCTQCHGIPPLHQTQHGGVATQFACMECHVDVHGSDHSKTFLDPDLGTKIGGDPATCWCHGVN